MSLIGGLQSFFMGGFEEEDDGDNNVINPVREREMRVVEPAPSAKNYALKHNNVTRLYPDSKYDILLTCPKNVDDTSAVINNLRENNVCVINLEGVEKSISQRVADVLGGAAYSLGCAVERISNTIFIIAPDGVNISGKLKSEIKSETSIFPWVASR